MKDNSQPGGGHKSVMHSGHLNLTPPMKHWVNNGPRSPFFSPIREKSFTRKNLPILIYREKNLEQIGNNWRRSFK